jgi:hypothetical protein
MKSTETTRRSATGALGAAAGSCPSREAPHSPQNFVSGGFALPHAGHADVREAPHSPQNFLPLSFVAPHAVQLATS